MRGPAPVLLSLVLSSGCAVGPALVRRVVYNREIEQVGVVPAPSGLHALGPLAEPGTFALDGELSTSASLPPLRPREQGAPGAFSASDWGRVRVARGLWRGWELGLELEGSPLSLAHPLATDLGDAEAVGVVGRGGPWLRARARLGGDFFLGGQLEAAGTLVPYNHTETLTTTVTYYSYDEPVDGGTRSVDVLERQAALFFLGWRTGASFGWTSPRGLDWSLSASGESLPSFYGFHRAVWSCSYYSDGTGACEPEPPRPADTHLLLVGSATAALGIPVGSNLTLLGSLSVHGTTARAAGDAVTLAPMSGSLGLRLGGRAHGM